jgi:hypothetical protein
MQICIVNSRTVKEHGQKMTARCCEIKKKKTDDFPYGETDPLT